MSPTVAAVAVGNASAARAWLALPFRLYRADPAWTPPLRRQERRIRRHVPSGAEVTRFLVRRDGVAAGRVACTTYDGLAPLHLSHYECVDDDDVAAELFRAVAADARRRGRSSIVGPRGHMLLGVTPGLQISGFDRPAPAGTPHHHPYYRPQWEDIGGYSPLDTMVSHAVERDAVPSFDWLADSLPRARAAGYHSPTFHRFADLARHGDALAEVLNEALAPLPNYLAIAPEDVPLLRARLKAVVVPEMVRLVFHGDRVVGVAAAFPELGRALRRCHGRLLPLGWLHLVNERRRTPVITLYVMAVRPEHQARGALVTAVAELAHLILDDPRWQSGELPIVDVTNDRSLSLVRGAMGGTQVAKFLVYERRL